ncbi:hypothetical protein ACTQ49_01945 [Luteococcus sp. Sow4_B9]|uniref:hypothetical protein n=1 Tax=Luteococcus sp. Sow4_B9 TaxID=3438792 RepID=UPI003F9A6A25
MQPSTSQNPTGTDPETTCEDDFAERLSGALRASRLTLGTVEARLRQAGCPVSSATLSYWQTGRSLPTRRKSLRAVEMLETVLGVPPGHLIAGLPGNTRLVWQPEAALPCWEQPRTALQELGLSFNTPFSTMTLHDVVVNDPQSRWQRQITRQLLHADMAEAVRFPIALSGSHPEPYIPLLRSLRGCRVGRVVTFKETSTLVAEMILPAPLSPGQLAMVSYEVLWKPEDGRFGKHGRSLATPVGFMTFELVFNDQRPSSAHYYHRGPGPVANWVQQPLTVGRTVQFTARDVAAGLHGVEWRQEES